MLSERKVAATAAITSGEGVEGAWRVGRVTTARGTVRGTMPMGGILYRPGNGRFVESDEARPYWKQRRASSI